MDGAAWLFNAFVLIAGTGYLVGGTVIGKIRGGAVTGAAPAGGPHIMTVLRVHSHYALWSETAGLARDGGAFSLDRVRAHLGACGGTGAAAAGARLGPDPVHPEVSVGSASQRSSSSRKSSSSSRKGGSKKEKSNKVTKESAGGAKKTAGRGGGEQPLLEETPAEAVVRLGRQETDLTDAFGRKLTI
jgi:hypothetical protein